MTESQSSPKLIYLHIQNLVNELLGKLDEQNIHSETEIDPSECPTRELLVAFHKKITEQLEVLEKNAEWNTYTIAFYGETNAGKSTIIESLRLLLEEELKTQQQEKFQAWQNESGVSASAYEMLREDIDDIEKKLKTATSEWRSEKDELEEKRKSLLTEYNKQKFHVQKIKNRAGFFKRLKWYFTSMPYFPDFKTIEKDLETHQKHISNKETEQDLLISEMNASLSEKKNQFNRLEDRLIQAKNFADGAIIGNGRADFTHETTKYLIQKNGIHFQLLDMPGIEGNESKVVDDILASVKKAHAVVYVTSKAAMPESCEVSQNGTLEKIQSHLNHQSDIWAVFNKRITHPMQLEKPLLSETEAEGVVELEQSLRELFGENFKSLIRLSANPSFLGLASCLLPGSANYRQQEKFLDKYSHEALVDKSQIADLMDIFSLGSPEAIQEKIEQSNLIKAKKIAQTVFDEVVQLQHAKFTPMYQVLNQHIQASEAELRSVLSATQGKIKAAAQTEMDQFEVNTRASLYQAIDENIDNQTFVDVFESKITTAKTLFIEKLTPSVEREVELYFQQIAAVIEKQNKHISDVLHTYNKVNHLDYQLNAQTKWDQLLNSFKQSQPMQINMGVCSSALSIVSDDFKRSQQRKVADSKLRDVVENVHQHFDENVQLAMQALSTQIDTIQAAMLLSIKPIQDVHQYLDLAEKEFNQLVMQLEAY